MRKIFLLISLLLINASAKDAFVYLATSDRAALDVFSLNEKSGELKKLTSVPLSDNPDVLAFSKDKKFIYVGLRKSQPKKKKGKKTPVVKSDGTRGIIVSLEIGADGIPVKKASIASDIQVRFMSPDHTGKYLLVTDYFAGKSSVIKLQNGIAGKEVVSQQETEPFSHSIVISKNNKFAYAPHTAPNKVYQFKFDEKTGALSNNGSSQSPPKDDKRYFAPRHAAWHPILPVLYTSNEHSGGISTWKMNSDGSLQLVQTLSSLPADYEGNSTAADVQVTPDGKYVYVSNRGKKGATSKSGTNTLACFAIDTKSGEVKKAGHFKTAERPRSFYIAPSGKSVIAAGQASKSLAVHSLGADGSLSLQKTVSVDGRPNWLLIK